MLAESGGIAAAPRRVAVIVALEVERRALRGRGDGVLVRVSGPGRGRAAAAAEASIAAGAAALVSFGLAGGLAQDAMPGRLMLPRAVLVPGGRRFDVDEPWRGRIAAELGRELEIDDRPLLAADGIVGTPERRRRRRPPGPRLSISSPVRSPKPRRGPICRSLRFASSPTVPAMRCRPISRTSSTRRDARDSRRSSE